MQQFLCVTIVLLFAVLSNVQSDMSKETEKILADIGICKNETGASDADIEELHNRGIPTTKVGKCFNKCMFNRLEILKDGKLSPEGLIKVIEMDKSDLRAKDGKTLLDSMKDIIGECNKVTDTDECELTAKLRTCLNVAAKKREICPNVF
ncbi:general odorant-binding protein 19d-like [Bradysia coprophila]|uniref:general odorant-binding protein 19d-like n=1 Tax=Bradysia coprophila TaxID=38358 RepID=UPI00187D9C08|nr:general odorant-binding protein 19d-like [Bradysia coprophila]